MNLDFLATAAETEAERVKRSLEKPTRATAQAKQDGKRDSKGWRTAPKKNKFGESTQAGDKAAAKKHENEVKAETRRKVWARTSQCDGCGDTEDQTARKWEKREHEANEILPRSATRGLPPEFRFSTENTSRLCVECHRLFHRKRLKFVFDSPLRMDGPFLAVFS